MHCLTARMVTEASWLVYLAGCLELQALQHPRTVMEGALAGKATIL